MEKIKSIQDLKKIPMFSQFTDEQILAQYKKNLQGLEQMKEKADKTGKKVNGYTADQLGELIQDYKNIIATA